MLLDLPPELLRMTLQYLSAKDLARVERTCTTLRAQTTDHGWGDASYGTDRVVHEPARPRTSPEWRALCLQRAQRTTAIRTQFPQRPPAERALDLFALGRFADVIVSLQCDNAVDADMYLHTMGRALSAQGRTSHAARFAGFRDAVRRDDAQTVVDSMRYHGVRTTPDIVGLAMNSSLPRVSKAVAQEVLRARLPWQNTVIHQAIRRCDKLLVKHLLDLGFRASITSVRQYITLRPLNIFDWLVEHQGFTPAQLDYAVSAVLDSPQTPNTLDLLRKLHRLGAPFRAYYDELPTGSLQATPIFRGGVRSTPAVLQTLCDLGANPRAVGPGNTNAWHWLAETGAEDLEGVATFLHEQGVDIGARAGSRQQTPVAVAIAAHARSLSSDDFISRLLSTLVSFGASLDGPQERVGDSQVTTLQLIRNFVHKPWGRTLLNLGLSVPPSYLSTLLRDNDQTTLYFFLEANTWSRREREQGLAESLAFRRSAADRAKILRLLVRHGADPNGLYPLPANVSGARQELLNQFLANVSAGDMPLAMCAILSAPHGENILSVLKAINGAGGRIEAKTPSGANAWHALAMSDVDGIEAVADYLIARRVDINAVCVNPAGRNVRPADVLLLRGVHHGLARAFFSRDAVLSNVET